MRTTSGWPEKFTVSQFDHDDYNRSGQLMNLTKSIKSSVLKKLASVIYVIRPTLRYWSVALLLRPLWISSFVSRNQDHIIFSYLIIIYFLMQK